MATSTPALRSGAFDEGTRKQRSLWADAWRRLTRNKAAVVGMFVIAFFILVAIFAPLLAPHNPVVQVPKNGLRAPVWVSDSPGLPPVPQHTFGTDTLGRDQLSKLLYGARVSMIVGLVPTIFVVIIGVFLGLISGFSGGWLDNGIMRTTEIVASFPDLLFIITITVALRDTAFGRAFNGLFLIFIALALLSWTGMARLVRGQVLSLKQKEFVEAARTVGTPTWKILFRHILPNTMAPILVSVSFLIPGFILGEAGLTFLGVGMRLSVDPSNPFPTSWGVMVQEGYNNLSSGPWLLIPPVLCIALVMLAFTFIGDGLRDALDPRETK
ncbi:MAG: ABC transporter permease [Chloroflexi bacterium]|nr:MAG: ABC transporter permease [Chloroflexota bacterium]